MLRDARPSTRTGRAAALTVYSQFLELRHKIEQHNITGRVVECPLDEMNRPRASVDPQLRVPPTEQGTTIGPVRDEFWPHLAILTGLITGGFWPTWFPERRDVAWPRRWVPNPLGLSPRHI